MIRPTYDSLVNFMNPEKKVTNIDDHIERLKMLVI